MYIITANSRVQSDVVNKSRFNLVRIHNSFRNITRFCIMFYTFEFVRFNRALCNGRRTSYIDFGDVTFDGHEHWQWDPALECVAYDRKILSERNVSGREVRHFGSHRPKCSFRAHKRV